MRLPKVSIIIPVKPGGAVKALTSLRRVDYPEDLLEVIIAEGRQPSRQRNEAANSASGEILYFLDDDSQVQNGFLRKAAGHFADPRTAVVGGPSLTPADDSLFQQAFGAALSSVFGGGGVRNRYRQTGEVRFTGDQELILCNLGFRRDIFLQFGGLDLRLYPNEENELLDRLQSARFLCVHDPQMAVFRSQRPTFMKFVQQLFSYGRGRGEQTRISGRIPPASIIPSMFLTYLLLLPLGDNIVYYVPLLCYAFSVLGFAVYDAVRVRMCRILPLLLLIFPAMHLAYGAGLIYGLINPRFKRRQVMEGEVILTAGTRDSGLGTR